MKYFIDTEFHEYKKKSFFNVGIFPYNAHMTPYSDENGFCYEIYTQILKRLKTCI